MMTIKEFVKEHSISISSERATSNPRLMAHNVVDAHFATNCTHWKVMLKRRKASRATLTVYFSRASKSNESSPEVEEVLDSLAVDALSANADPREISSELTIDLDTAKNYIDICRKRANGLKRVLGEEGFKKLISETHRILS